MKNKLRELVADYIIAGIIDTKCGNALIGQGLIEDNNIVVEIGKTGSFRMHGFNFKYIVDKNRRIDLRW